MTTSCNQPQRASGDADGASPMAWTLRSHPRHDPTAPVGLAHPGPSGVAKCQCDESTWGVVGSIAKAANSIETGQLYLCPFRV